MNNRKDYDKKVKNRRLSKFGEYNILNVGWVISLVIALVISFYSKDSITGVRSSSVMAFAMAYFAAAAIGFLLSLKIYNDITTTNEVSVFARRASLILIPFIFTGNFFIGIAGFSCCKSNKSIEYTLAFYSFLNMVLIIIISLLNLFKPYVANSFLTGIYVIGGVSLFYIILIFVTCQFTVAKNNYNKLLPFAILSILSGITGNLFAIFLGIIIIGRIDGMRKNKQPEWIETIRRLFRNYMSIIGMFVVILLLTLSICSILTFDYSIATDNDYSVLLARPSLMYPFGTDLYGRCVFTRIVFGARISLMVGFASAVIPLLIGGFLGALAGHFGGKTDNSIMRVLDIIYAVPGILLAIAIVAAFGASTINLIMALSIGAIPAYARTMRAQVMVVTSSEFVEAARACGRKDFSIIFNHIVPNALAPMIVRITISIGGAVLSTSSLSFLGLGVEPHIPEWGNILKGGSAYLETNSYLAIFPGLAIILIVLAFNFFGDGLRDALDPKLK